MAEIKTWVEGLVDPDHSYAYQCLKQLEQESLGSSAVYAYFDGFAALLNNKNSYVRTRAIRLIAANVQWDTENKTETIIDSYMSLLADPKPITIRQCIQAFPQIAVYKPALIPKLCSALRSLQPDEKGAMGPLIQKDIQTALQAIQKAASQSKNREGGML